MRADESTTRWRPEGSTATDDRRLRFVPVRISLSSGVVAATALAALLSGCTSSEAGSASPASGSSPAGSSASSSSAAEGTPPTATALQAAVLQESELPAGWTASPYEADPGDDSGAAGLLKCVGGRDTSPDEIDEEHSPDFSSAEGSTISSSASSYRSQQDIDDDVAVFTNPAVSGCLSDQLSTLLESSGLPAGTTVGDPQVSITPGSNGGPDNVIATLTGTIPLTMAGQQITFYLDMAFITGRFTEAEVDFFGVGAPVPADLRSSLVTTVATRVGAL